MILNQFLPHNPFDRRRLPGVAPIALSDWMHVGDTHAEQMAARARLLAERRADVVWLADTAHAAADELLRFVLDTLPEGYVRLPDAVRRPDGVQVRIDRDDPLGTLGLIVQEDLCLMVRQGDEHVLAGAVLCFPSSWTLTEKAGRPLVSIHVPVPDYDDGVARRVQRLFDGVQPGRPLMRYNCLWYDSFELFHPRLENARHRDVDPASAPFLRSERQCLIRLPETGAVLFSIHTGVLSRARALEYRAAAEAGATHPA